MGSLVVVTAPSGAGKTTLIKRLLDDIPTLMFSISHTTRPKRETEVDGKDYHFVTRETFEEMIDNNEFIEWAKVHNEYYGTSYKELMKTVAEDNDIILDVDVQGAMALRDKKQRAFYVFIKPPSIEVLKDRLENRQSESSESLELRIWNAKRELAYAPQFDKVIVNEIVDKAYQEFKEAVLDYLED